MSFLTDDLPHSIKVCGKDYIINTDFKVFLKVSTIAEDRNLNDKNKIVRIVSEVFKGYPLPPSLTETISGIMEFYHGAKSTEKKHSESGKSNRIIDYEEDAGMIWAAVLAQYGIDLTEVQLHWWKFIELLSSLSGEHKLLRVMHYRGMDCSKIKDKGKRAEARRLQLQYRLPEKDKSKLNDDEIANMFC